MPDFNELVKNLYTSKNRELTPEKLDYITKNYSGKEEDFVKNFYATVKEDLTPEKLSYIKDTYLKKKDISQPDFQFGSQTSPFGSKTSQTQVPTEVPSVLTEQGKVGYEQEVQKKAQQKQKLSEQLKSAKSAFISAQGEDVARDIEMYQADPELFREVETNTWLGNAIKKGLLKGDVANAIPTADYNPSPEAISKAADANYKIGIIPQSEAEIEFQKSGFGVFKDPLLGAQWLTETAASSLAGLYQAAKRTVPLAVGAGATAGSAFFGVGAIPGAALGLQSGLSVAGLNLATSSNIIESIKDSGVDVTNRNDLIKAFSDDNKMSEIRSTALKYGVPIMVLDMATAGIAGKLIGGAAGKSIARKIGAGLGEAGIQATGGMIGELSGQALSGQEIDWNEVAAEGVVSLFTDAPDIAIGAMTRDKASSSNKNIVTQINKFGAEEGAVDAKINLDRDLANGTITPDEYEQGVEFIGKAVVANEKIPIGIEGESREKSIELIAKKDDILLDIEELNKQKEGVDDSFYPAIDEQIKAKEAEVESINKSIQETAKPPTGQATAQPTQEPTVEALKDVDSTTKQLQNISKKDPSKVEKIFGEDIVYHGTKKDFDEFDENKMGGTDDGWYGKGFYFHSDRDRGGYGDIVKAAKIDLKKPIILPIQNSGQYLYDIIGKEAGLDESFRNEGSQNIIREIGSDRFSEIAKKLGYDGVIVNYAQGTQEVVAFDKKSIKQANPKSISEAYHKAKKDGSSPELVKAVENLLKPKEDAVQKQTTGQVPVQPEAPVSEEVVQGKPEAKPEVVTEEGVKAEEVAPIIESISSLQLDENNLESVIEELEFIDDAKRKVARPSTSNKTKAKLNADIEQYEANIADKPNEVRIAKTINDNFDKIKKDLKEQGLLNVKC
jgi:hypothetical protein